MAHNHGNEYQIRIVREDGIEELSGWMNSTEQVAQAMLAVHRPQGKTCWLLVRDILCPKCSDREQLMGCFRNRVLLGGVLRNKTVATISSNVRTLLPPVNLESLTIWFIHSDADRSGRHSSLVEHGPISLPYHPASGSDLLQLVLVLEAA
jgi:hypothetical protein